MPCSKGMARCRVGCLHRAIVQDYRDARAADEARAESMSNGHSTERADYLRRLGVEGGRPYDQLPYPPGRQGRRAQPYRRYRQAGTTTPRSFFGRVRAGTGLCTYLSVPAPIPPFLYKSRGIKVIDMDSGDETPALFEPVEQAAPRRARWPSPVRDALEGEIDAAEGLPPTGVETLRVLADQIDRLNAWLAGQQKVRPFDTQPLAGLLHQWEETYERVFGQEEAGDELDGMVAEWRKSEGAYRPNA